MKLDVFISAFAVGLGLIIAIGAQNVFVIKTGLQGKNVFLAASIAAFCDLSLIAAGTLLMSLLSALLPAFIAIAKWAGVAFLAVYGCASLFNGLRADPRGWSRSEEEISRRERGFLRRGGAREVVVPALAFSLLNPHVYIDTFLVLGNLGARMPPEARLSFVLGAGGASFFWFYTTGFAARFAGNIFESGLITRLFDIVVGLVMLGIGYGLLVTPI